MKIKIILAQAVSILCLAGQQAHADFCDYRPTQLVGGGASAALAASGAGAAVAGAGAKIAGFYTLTHSVTGLTMLGSTAGGASAAGTVGIMGGTAGALGTAGAILMAPATITAGAVVGVGIGTYEGICFFSDERVTEFDEVLSRMERVAEKADKEFFQLITEDKETGEELDEPYIKVRNEKGEWEDFSVSNLYIVNTVLMHRDWFRNTTIGHLGFVQQE